MGNYGISGKAAATTRSDVVEGGSSRQKSESGLRARMLPTGSGGDLTKGASQSRSSHSSKFLQSEM